MLNVSTVLLVEDDADSREAMKELLELEGHHVDLAADGIDALALYRPDVHEAVICDVGMPRMDGISLAREIKTRNPRAKVVLLTGWDDAQSEEKNVDAVFSKPVDFGRLEQFLEGL